MKEQQRSGGVGILWEAVERRALTDSFPGTRAAKCHVSRKRMRGQGGREAGSPSAPELLLSPLALR